MFRTYQQNGIVKRHNCTLMDVVTSMLNYSIVPLFLWMHALKNVAYMFNRVLSKAIPKTPYKLWIGRKLSLRHFHI